jgi:hypothetical protein
VQQRRVTGTLMTGAWAVNAWMILNAGTGTWTVGDVNGDGRTDLVYIHPSDDTVWTFVSQGNGGYQGLGYSIGAGFDAGTGTWF